MFEQKIDLEVLEATLLGSVNSVFAVTCKENFSKDPTIQSKPLKRDNGKMHVSTGCRILVSGFVSVIYYYDSVRNRDKNKPCGAFILYVKESTVFKLLKAFGYISSDYEDKDNIRDMCGELCNQLAGSFKQDLASTGYKNLEISVPRNYKDIVPGGVFCPKRIKQYHEMDIFFEDSRAASIDLLI